jgi:hypothetical protein
MMTELLRRAFARAQELAAADQDRLGAWILEEIAEEHDEAVLPPDGVDVLKRMAAEARAEDESGRTRPLEDVLEDYRRHGRFSGV